MRLLPAGRDQFQPDLCAMINSQLHLPPTLMNGDWFGFSAFSLTLCTLFTRPLSQKYVIKTFAICICRHWDNEFGFARIWLCLWGDSGLL